MSSSIVRFRPSHAVLGALVLVMGCSSSHDGNGGDASAGGASVGGASGATASSGGEGGAVGTGGGTNPVTGNGGTSAGTGGSGAGGAASGNGGTATGVGGADPSAGGVPQGMGGRRGRGGSPFGGSAGMSMAGGAASSGGTTATGGATSAGGTGGACTPNTACMPAAPSTGDINADCVARVNQFRACVCLPPLQRWTDGEACASQDASYDAQNQSMGAHAGFKNKICAAGNAQDECPGWKSDDQVISGCLQQMFNEGPPPTATCDGTCYEQHGHYINMTNTRYTMVACGYYTGSDGKVWAVQNFK
ncbi:MAG TPA: CAP domain-containing protein [Polyangiaceae bacterium]|jgi:hypothetical protein|nr:CAP domain-containing protein [Polyangiaceae bacterium]